MTAPPSAERQRADSFESVFSFGGSVGFRFGPDPKLLGVDDEFLAIVSGGECTEPQGLGQSGVGTVDPQLTFGCNPEITGLGPSDLKAHFFLGRIDERFELRNIENIETWHYA